MHVYVGIPKCLGMKMILGLRITKGMYMFMPMLWLGCFARVYGIWLIVNDIDYSFYK